MLRLFTFYCGGNDGSCVVLLLKMNINKFHGRQNGAIRADDAGPLRTTCFMYCVKITKYNTTTLRSGFVEMSDSWRRSFPYGVGVKSSFAANSKTAKTFPRKFVPVSHI